MADRGATFDQTYAALRDMMLAEADRMTVARDLPGDLQLRTPDIDAKTGEPGWFGTVTIKKSYVAYHLMPLYYDQTLTEGISDALAQRRQGKTCFNFTRHNAALFAELAALTRRCARAVRPE